MLVRLEWDSAHFGFPVARAEPAELSVEELRTDLARAREDGVRLVYCLRAEERPLPEELLREFGGCTICTQVQWCRVLPEHGGTQTPEGSRIERFVESPAPEDLRRLAIEAGRYSRFRLDPRISRAAFESLYALWLENSVRGTLADHVLVARDETGASLGLVTVAHSSTDSRGKIGLLSVDPGRRRFGIAKALMAAAEDRMREAGCAESEVVTQQENGGACRFYDAIGYSVRRRTRADHFWLENVTP